MKNTLKQFFKNLDNDQKAILKSVAIISSIVLPIGFAIPNLTPLILALILQIIITPFFANKVKHKKQYTLDKKSNKRFKTSLIEKFSTVNFVLYIVAGIVMTILYKHTYITAFIALTPLWATRFVAFKLKLPVSALLSQSLPNTPSNSSYDTHKTSQFDSTSIKSGSVDTIHNTAYSSNPNNIYHVPPPRRD